MGDMPHPDHHSCRGCRIISIHTPNLTSQFPFLLLFTTVSSASLFSSLPNTSLPSTLGLHHPRWWCVLLSLCFYPLCWICLPITFTLNDCSLSFLVMPTTLELFICNLEKIDSWLCERENYILIFFVPLALSTNIYVCKLMTQMIISGITFSFPYLDKILD